MKRPKAELRLVDRVSLHLKCYSLINYLCHLIPSGENLTIKGIYICQNAKYIFHFQNENKTKHRNEDSPG